MWSVSSVDEDVRTAGPLLPAGGGGVNGHATSENWCDLGTGDFPEFSQANYIPGPHPHRHLDLIHLIGRGPLVLRVFKSSPGDFHERLKLRTDAQP